MGVVGKPQDARARVAADITHVRWSKRRRPLRTGVDTPRCAGPYVRSRFQTRTGKLPPLVPCNRVIVALMPTTSPHTPLPPCSRKPGSETLFWFRGESATHSV